MSTESKSLTSTGATITTGGIGAILSVVVGAAFPDPNNLWRNVAYASVPIVAASLTYFMNWVISRHGLESPEDAGKRSKCMRDLKEIDKQLKFLDYSDEFKKSLIKEKERTVQILVNIGKDSKSFAPETPVVKE